MSAPRSAPPGFWQRRIVQPIVAQLTQGITPDRIALTLGVGLACGVFPFLGFTTALCFIAAAAFGLNQPIIHVLNQLLWPVQLALIPVYVRLGAALHGAEALPFDPPEVSRVFFASQREFWSRFGLMGLQALTAWLLSLPLLVGGTWLAARPILRRLASARVGRP
ncbi:MAG TPA: DUF2062 domain-containing protein [Acidobacteriota bacterium]|nr:DUF2062 domain-containing protein [Acidobacteriota bacterium]